ncbi:MAG: LacI family DNA-binding transcriptional regulator [Bacteroidetes bacterium]|nr:LacI family DNA-binding transcriptional regulator [Bacteroidota bacterium]
MPKCGIFRYYLNIKPIQSKKLSKSGRKLVKKSTIADVAKRAGVSKGTVSAVINAKTTVKPSTRDLILEIMKEMNFRPTGLARNLKNGSKDKSIGIII